MALLEPQQRRLAFRHWPHRVGQHHRAKSARQHGFEHVGQVRVRERLAAGKADEVRRQAIGVLFVEISTISAVRWASRSPAFRRSAQHRLRLHRVPVLNHSVERSSATGAASPAAVTNGSGIWPAEAATHRQAGGHRPSIGVGGTDETEVWHGSWPCPRLVSTRTALPQPIPRSLPSGRMIPPTRASFRWAAHPMEPLVPRHIRLTSWSWNAGLAKILLNWGAATRRAGWRAAAGLPSCHRQCDRLLFRRLRIYRALAVATRALASSIVRLHRHGARRRAGAASRNGPTTSDPPRLDPRPSRRRGLRQ